MTDLFSLLQREFMILPRQRGFYWRRIAIMALPTLILLFGLIVGSYSSATSNVGLSLFRQLTPLLIFTSWIAATMIAGNLVVKEVEEQTMQVLSLTYISLPTLFIGKYFTAMVYSCIAVGATLPLLLLTVSLGGVAPSQVLALTLLVLSVIALGCGTGLLVGILSRTALRFAGTSLLLVVLMMVLTPLLGEWLVVPTVSPWLRQFGFDTVSWGNDPEHLLSACLSPFIAGWHLSNRQADSVVYAAIICNVLFGQVLALAGLPFLRRVSQGEPLFAVPRMLRGSKSFSRRSRPHRSKPPIGDNPMQWRDYYFVHGTWRRAAWIVGILCVSVPLGLYILAQNNGMYDPQYSGDSSYIFQWLAGSWGVIIGACLVFYMLGLTLRSSSIFLRDQKSSLLEFLMLTDITPEEIVRGKTQALNLSLLPYFAPVVLHLLGSLVYVIIANFGRDESGVLETVSISGVYLTLGSLMLWGFFGYGMPRIGIWLSLLINNASFVLITMLVGVVGLSAMTCGLCAPVVGIGVLVTGFAVNDYILRHMRRVILVRAR